MKKDSNIKIQQIIKEIKKNANPKNVEGMARFGINPNNTFGVSIPILRGLAKKIGKNHDLALELWKTEIHEARILAGFIGESSRLTEKQMESWVKEFDSWDVCDLVCSNLFDKTEFAYDKVFQWHKDKREFVKRAGFVMMACLAVHDKKASDNKFIQFFPLIIKESVDERNFVKKAVNWALRQIGKRNLNLNKEAVKTGKIILKKDSKSAKWIARDALRELTNEEIIERIKNK